MVGGSELWISGEFILLTFIKFIKLMDVIHIIRIINYSFFSVIVTAEIDLLSIKEYFSVYVFFLFFSLIN